MKPADALTGRFDWSDYLQQWLTRPSVVVSKLHPIFGMRLAALFIELDMRGIAGTRVRIGSGVRSKKHQTQLWNADLAKNGGRPTGYVANPRTIHGVDGEGVQRAGSNHMPQRAQWGDDVGYAADLWNRDGTGPAAYRDIHPLLRKYGLDWPLKGPGVIERWHIEWHPRRAGGPLSGDLAWPDRPGTVRPIMRGMLGGDVKLVQRQAGVSVDGVAGPQTEAGWRNMQKQIGRPQTDRWGSVDQMTFEKRTTPSKEATIEAPVIPTAAILKHYGDRINEAIKDVQGVVDEMTGDT